MSIGFLVERIEQAARKEAFVWRNERFDYAWLRQRMAAWTQRLDRAGVTAGTVTALAGDMSPDTIAALLALFERDAIAVPIVPSSHPDWPDLVVLARCEVIVRAGTAAVDGDDIERTRLTAAGDHPLYGSLRTRQAAGLVLFSSGTTGARKAAVHDVTKLERKFTTRRHDLRTLVFMAIDHIGGIDTILYALSNSSALVLGDDMSPDAVCAAVERHRVEVLPAVPTFLALLAISQAYRRYDLSSVKFVTYGSEVMGEALLKKCREIFPQATLLQKYGTTEVGTLRSVSRSSDSLWVRVGGEGYQTRVVNGMLEIKADSAMLGYLNAPSPFTADGWFVTRDCVEVDGDYIRFLGRESEIINVGGHKVFPGEVEDVIREFGGIADVTVFGKANPLLGQIVCARVTLHEARDRRKFTAALKRHCLARLPDYQVPVVVTVDDGAAASSPS